MKQYQRSTLVGLLYSAEYNTRYVCSHMAYRPHKLTHRIPYVLELASRKLCRKFQEILFVIAYVISEMFKYKPIVSLQTIIVNGPFVHGGLFVQVVSYCLTE